MSGTYRHPAGVAWVVDQGTVYVAPLPEGPVQVLNGAGAAVWVAAVGLDADATVASVAGEAGLAPGAVRADVLSFLDQLVELGLLERV